MTELSCDQNRTILLEMYIYFCILPLSSTSEKKLLISVISLVRTYKHINCIAHSAEVHMIE